MSNDRFLERLRIEAQSLRFEPSHFAVTRMSARIRERIATPTVSQLLANWMRPLALSFGAIALVSTLGVAWYESQETVAMESTIAQSNIDVEMAGYSFGD
ncbi:MAG: hypothetical protein QOI24_3947 [Acidobacteriota bacterium]|jgi:hypothetical protein|nr:hypothetical protein [Acidobacteriota bacterium]